MSKSNTETFRTIPMPIDPTYKVISVKKSLMSKEIFIITGISEQDVAKLKSSNGLVLKRGKCTFEISPDDVLCFGDIDFHEGSDDCKELDTFNWLDSLYIQGVPIPSRYNYEKHECYTNKVGYLWTETFRNSVLCRYYHGCLGKPEFTLIFREVV